MKIGYKARVWLALGVCLFSSACSKDEAEPALGGAGESCQKHSDCNAPLQCLNNACTMVNSEMSGADASAPVVRSQAGESCVARTDCAVGLVCINNVCQTEADSGPQTGAGKRGEACQTRADCLAGLSCVKGVCTKADFGIAPTDKECVQIDCMEPKDCCPQLTTVDTTCATYAQYCEAGLDNYCTYYNANCKCTGDAYVCTADHRCQTKMSCSDAGLNQCPFGFICNNGTDCVRCIKDSDCGASQVCTPQHTCMVSCTKNGDCAYLQTCNAGACTDTGCMNDRECIAQSQNPLSVCAAGKCETPCQSDAECNLATYAYSACVGGFCQDIGCESDEECRIRLHIPFPSNKQALCQKKQ